MKIQWYSPIDEKRIIANSLGYGLANARLKEALGRITPLSDDGDVVLHFCHPWLYRPIVGKKNVIMTMNEHDYLTPDYQKAFAASVAIVTPSTYCKSVFQKYTDTPVHVSPLGVDTDLFTFKNRSWSPQRKETFRWLVVCAPNIRKFSILEEVYKILFYPMGEQVELYIKTTGADMDQDVMRKANWTIDNRYVDTKHLVKLYHSAHGFLSLHLGEGWGIPSLEAMATGLPLVVSDHTGTQDFANKTNSFPVKVEIGKIDVLVGEKNDQIKSISAGIPDLADTIKQIGKIMSDYPRALTIARQGARDAKNFTWTNAAKSLLEVLTKV